MTESRMPRSVSVSEATVSIECRCGEELVASYVACEMDGQPVVECRSCRTSYELVFVCREYP